MIELLYPADKERICIHTQVIKDFIYHNGAGHHYNNREREDAYSWLREYYDGRYTDNYKNNPDELNLTRPQSVSFAWRSSVPCKLVISPCHDFSTTCLDYPASPECCEIVYKGEYDGVFHAEADQLFSDTNYYWKVVAEDGSEESVPRSFVTFGGYPRFIFAEGTANFRDLGGLATYDGKRTRQGCVYRCAALDSEIESNYDLTERGARVLRDIVKLRCELDIRREAFGVKKSSVLGDSVLRYSVCRGVLLSLIIILRPLQWSTNENLAHGVIMTTSSLGMREAILLSTSRVLLKNIIWNSAVVMPAH